MIKKLTCAFALTIACHTAFSQTLTLTPAHISCFGLQDGSIVLTITGGTPPYTMRWSTDDTTATINNLPAGYYHVEVNDADTTTGYVEAEITLTEPEEIRAQLTASDYVVATLHYNISLYGACNGSITIAATGGVQPYSYQWNPFGQTTATLSNVCAGAYEVVVTDANACTQSFEQAMSEPERSDWRTEGNANSDPATQFIGTTDNKNFIFKTNSVTRLNLKGNGDVVFPSLAGTGDRLLLADSTGKLKIIPILIPNCATDPPVIAFQQSPVNPADVFTCWRNVGIGTYSPQEKLEVKGMAKFGGWNTTTSYIKIGHDGVDAFGQGGNSNIDSYGNGDLNINTYSPKNVNISTGNSGNVTLGGNNYFAPGGGKFVNIGTPSNSNYKLNVGGEINATGIRIGGIALNLANQWLTGVNPNDIYYNLGNVGINETNPDEKLVVNDGFIKIKKNGKTLRLGAENGNPWCGDIGSSTGRILFWFGAGVGYNKLTCGALEVISNNDGALNFKVDQDGFVQARSLKVTLNNFADDVFNKDYKLMPLKELEAYLIKNKRLPEIPSEKEIVKDGLDVGIMLTKAFQKIEELTLYVIDLKKENDSLKSRLENLEKK